MTYASITIEGRKSSAGGEGFAMSWATPIEVEDSFVRWLCDLGIPPAEGERLLLDGQKHRYKSHRGSRHDAKRRILHLLRRSPRRLGKELERQAWRGIRRVDVLPAWGIALERIGLFRRCLLVRFVALLQGLLF